MFIKLTEYKTNNKLIVNLNKATQLTDSKKTTCIEFGQDYWVIVNESIEDIYKSIEQNIKAPLEYAAMMHAHNMGNQS